MPDLTITPDTYRSRFAQALSFGDFVAGARNTPELWRSMTARARVPAELVARAGALPGRWQLLVLVEDWCGDAVNIVPWLAALADAVPQLTLRVLGRDANPDLMNAHLSPTGGRAIPVVIVLDEDFAEVGWWGSRPRALQAWVDTPEAQAMPKDDRYRETRKWYARDGGRSTLEEVLAIAEEAVASNPAWSAAEAAVPRQGSASLTPGNITI